MPLLAAQSPGTAAPARGAPLSDLVALTIAFAVAGLVLAAVAIGHRRGRLSLLRRVGAFPPHAGGVPPRCTRPHALRAVRLRTPPFRLSRAGSRRTHRGPDP